MTKREDGTLRILIRRAKNDPFGEGRIAQKVRTSGPPPSGMMDAMDSTPGPMPFFEPSDLSDDDLSNIIAYIKSQGS